MKFDDEVKKQLDAVVGESYDPPRNWRATAAKWLVVAVLAVATSAAIVSILDFYLIKAHKAPPPSRPVQVRIVPAK